MTIFNEWEYQMNLGKGAGKSEFFSVPPVSVAAEADSNQLMMELHQRGMISTEGFCAALDIDFDKEIETLRAEAAPMPPSTACPICASVDVDTIQNVHICRNCPCKFSFNKVADQTVYEVETTIKLLDVSMVFGKECPDCKGKKVYVGLFKTEACPTCKGTGTV
jgi:hypothetical protein